MLDMTQAECPDRKYNNHKDRHTDTLSQLSSYVESVAFSCNSVYMMTVSNGYQQALLSYHLSGSMTTKYHALSKPNPNRYPVMVYQ